MMLRVGCGPAWWSTTPRKKTCERSEAGCNATDGRWRITPIRTAFFAIAAAPRHSRSSCAEKPLGCTTGASLRRASGCGGGNRTTAGWLSLATLPETLPALAALSRAAAGFRKSFRPTASRTYETKSPTPKGVQTQIPCASRTPLEKTLEADISTLRKRGHFYFALTRNRLVFASFARKKSSARKVRIGSAPKLCKQG